MGETTHRELLRRFNYCPQTGILTHRQVTTNRVKEGDQVGSLHSRGYLHTRLDGKTVKVHRVIWFYQTGQWPDQDIDHIDGDRSNNAWSNLRACSRAQNLQNMKAKNPQSGFKGVVRRGGSYMVRLRANKQTYHVGSFSSAKEAAEAYDQAALQLQGSFAKTNKALGLL